MKKKVWVSGAAGFIGSHLTESLIDSGCDVRCFLRYNSRNDQGLLRFIPNGKRERIDIRRGDLRDRHAVHESIKGVDVVFHLGAIISIPYSYKNPVEVVDTNVMGTLNVMMAARDLGVEKVIHTSTSEVYGTARTVPIHENHVLQAQSPYAASKIGADKIVESFCATYGLPAAIVRPFNVYGPRQSLRAVIPSIIAQILTKDEIVIGNLKPTRDFTYVQDTAQAVIDIAESNKTEKQTINVGSNFEISIGEIVEKITALIGKKVQVVQDKKHFRPKNSEVERLWADNTTARDILNWKPAISLEEGLGRTIDWIENHLDIYTNKEYVI